MVLYRGTDPSDVLYSPLDIYSEVFSLFVCIFDVRFYGGSICKIIALNLSFGCYKKSA